MRTRSTASPVQPLASSAGSPTHAAHTKPSSPREAIATWQEPSLRRSLETTQPEWATAPQKRTRSMLRKRTSPSLQVLGLHVIAVENVLVPWCARERTVLVSNDVRPFHHQHDFLRPVLAYFGHPRHISRHIRP